jgi:DNA-directed RNA polymerase specialized sigma24 family protein
VEPGIDIELAAVWSAARAASADLAAAEDVTVAVMSRRPRDPPANRRTLVVEAVRRAVAIAPCAPLASLAADERESLALARLAGLDVDEIADIVGSDAAIIRRRLTNGLRALAEQSACAAIRRSPA